MTTAVTLNSELMATLQELADTRQMSVNELVEAIVSDNIENYRNDDDIYYPSPEELADLKIAVAQYEADKAAGRMIPLDEVKKTFKERIAAHHQKKQVSA